MERGAPCISTPRMIVLPHPCTKETETGRPFRTQDRFSNSGVAPWVCIRLGSSEMRRSSAPPVQCTRSSSPRHRRSSRWSPVNNQNRTLGQCVVSV
jgi:hypothetical protein